MARHLNYHSTQKPTLNEQELHDSDYEEINDNDSDHEGSYHSEGDEIAEYWDPYCKRNSTYCANIIIYSIPVTTASTKTKENRLRQTCK